MKRRKFLYSVGLLSLTPLGYSAISKLFIDLDQFKKEYGILNKEHRQDYLLRLKDAFNLDNFLFLKYYEGLEDAIKDGIIFPIDRERFRASLTITVPVVPLKYDVKSEKDLSIAITQNKFDYPLLKNRSLCIVFSELFEKNYYYFMSAIVDHEYKHTDTILNGIFVDDKELIYSTMMNFMPDLESSNIFYDLITELVAYNHQLTKGQFSDKISEEDRKFLGRIYLDEYLKLWDYGISNSIIKDITINLFYEPWLNEMVSTTDNYLIDNKTQNRYKLH